MSQRQGRLQDWLYSEGRASRGKYIIRARPVYPPANGEWRIVAASRHRFLAFLLAWWRTTKVTGSTGKTG